MIETVYRSPLDIPAPRTPQLMLPEEQGAAPCPWIDDTWRDAQRLGLELLWSCDYTLSVRFDGAEIVGDIQALQGSVPPLVSNIITKLDEFHYRVRLQQQIIVPRGLMGLLLPHPRYFDAIPHYVYNDTPAVVPRVLQLDRTREPIDLICRLPAPGAEHVFYAEMPVAQLVIVPRGTVNCREMTDEETAKWVTGLDELKVGVSSVS